MDIYAINSEYIDYLRKFDKKVMENEKEYGVVRPYIGVIFKVDSFNYFVPLSSPKDDDYVIIKGEKVLRKSVTPIHRIKIITSYIENGQKKEQIDFLGKLLFSNMIPVPESELNLIDLDNYPNEKYKLLLQNQIRYLRKNQSKLEKNHAKLIYKQKINNEKIGYLYSTVNFKLLEEKYNEFKNSKEAAIDKEEDNPTT